MATTQEPQWAEPALTAFAAAIHCESENRAIGGGITPRSSAQTSRSWGVLQQHDVQQSAACEHPQPPSWQGNASPDGESPPSSRARVAERTAWDGMTPVPAMQNAASSTHASARRAKERGLCNAKRIRGFKRSGRCRRIKACGEEFAKIEDRYPRARRGAVTAP